MDGQEKRKKFLRYTDIQLTRSLLVVTWAFIVLNLPNYIYRIIAKVLVVDTQVTSIHFAKHDKRKLERLKCKLICRHFEIFLIQTVVKSTMFETPCELSA